MRFVPWRRRVVWVSVLAVVIAAASSAIALSAFGGSGPAAPPSVSLAQAIQNAATAPSVPGITGTAKVSGDLLPDTSALGALGSSLTSATGHFWATGDGSGRIDVQSALGAVQLGWTKDALTIYEPASNTAYELQLPTSTGSHDEQPTLAQINQGLSKLGEVATITGPQPGVVADQPAYSVSLVPKDDSSLVGEVDVAWDATYGIPLHVSITPTGSSTPAIDVALSELTVGPVDASQATLNVPADAKVVPLSPPAHEHTGAAQSLTFTPVVPATLDGKALSSRHTAGGTELLTYGTGLSAIVVDERPADASGHVSGSFAALLPHVTLGPVSAQELETTLGTVVSFDRNGISFVVGASLPKGDVENAAQALATA